MAHYDETGRLRTLVFPAVLGRSEARVKAVERSVERSGQSLPALVADCATLGEALSAGPAETPQRPTP